MSEPDKRQTVMLGLFIAFAIAILAGGILAIGGMSDMFAQKIAVTAIFSDVSGLQKGGKGMEFTETADVRVYLEVEQDAARHIHSDALAKISSDGPIGNRLVLIYGGTASTPLLQDGDELAVGAMISTDQVLETFQQNNLNVLAITTDLKKISAQLAAGQGTAGRLVMDEGVYTSLSSAIASLDRASTNAVALVASLKTFSDGLSQPGHLPHDLVTDETTYAALVASVEKLEAAADHAAGLLDVLQRGASDQNTPAGTLLLDPEAGADVKASLDQLNQSSQLLATDLEALQHSILLRGAIRRQQRKAEK